MIVYGWGNVISKLPPTLNVLGLSTVGWTHHYCPLVSRIMVLVDLDKPDWRSLESSLFKCIKG